MESQNQYQENRSVDLPPVSTVSTGLLSSVDASSIQEQSVSESLELENISSLLNPPIQQSTHDDLQPSATTASAIGLDHSKHEPDIRHWVSHWIWEMLSFLLVFIALLAIVVTLWPHQGEPLPQWPFNITINALLSIYSMVFKASLMFVVASCIGQLQWTWFSTERPLYDVVRYDDATRGAWGSAQLLGYQRVLRQPLTAFGAFITLIALAIDPMIQQLIGPEDCSDAVIGEIASIPRTNALFAFPENVSSKDIATAINSRVYSSASSISGQCSTGNCTFPEVYSTLGICGYCQDISTDIKFNRTCYKSETDRGALYYYTGFDDCPNGQFENTTSTLPSGLKYTFSTKNAGEPMDTLVTGIPDGEERVDWYGHFQVEILSGKTALSGKGLDLLTFQNLTGCENETSNSAWRCRGYGAASCSLLPCVRRYRASLVAGRFTEHLEAKSAGIPWGNALIKAPGESQELGLLDSKCLSDDDKLSLRPLGLSLNDTDLWQPFNVPSSWRESESKEGQLIRSLLTRKCLSLIDSSVIDLKLGIPLIQALKGAVQGSHSVPGLSFYSPSVTGPQLLQQIYDYGNVDMESIEDTVTGISEGLTELIRLRGDGNWSEPAMGDVQQYAICLVVHWEWISFPALTALLSLVLFISVVATVSSQRTPVWKSSPLAWIYRGPSCKCVSINKEERTFTMEEMRKLSKTQWVQLVDKNNPLVAVRRPRDTACQKA